VISSSQRPLPANTQYSQQKHSCPPGGIRTHDLSRRAATVLRLRPRGHWDRHWYTHWCSQFHSQRLESLEKLTTENVRFQMKADYQSLFLSLPRDGPKDAVNSTVTQCDTLTAIQPVVRANGSKDNFRRLVDEVVVTRVGLWAIHNNL